MRPIDADALSEKLCKTTIFVKDGEKFQRMINDAPTVSAEARPTGEWIKATGMMPPEFHGHHCCSECGNFANMEPPFGNREDLSRFCPNCGADMRGGK